MDDVIVILGIIQFLFSAAFFVFTTKKLFSIKLGIPKTIAIFILSPASGYLISYLIYLSLFYNELSYGSADTTELWIEVILAPLFQLIVQLSFMFFYTKLVQCENKTVSVYLYLCSAMLVPGFMYVFTTTTVVPAIIYGALHVVFYFVVIKPLSDIVKKQIVTDVRLFVLLPGLTMIFNTLTYGIYIYIAELSNVPLNYVKEFSDIYHEYPDKTQHVYELFRRVISGLGYLADIFIYTSIFVVIILIVAFAVITKNIKYMNESMESQKKVKKLSIEVMEVLAHSIDAKDKYTHGHSTRVAEYSRKIAELAGKSKEECEEIYFAGLLHDVGKIGVPDTIISKDGKLTDEEYNLIKMHPVYGDEILREITEHPYLSIAARHHHERFDGKGYPDKLVGTDIPDIARIIAVADAYDAMTSKRSYRKTIPQQKVREEFVACAGTQFDPQYANIMLHLIDSDTQYMMKEKELNSPTIKDELIVGSHKDNVSIGITVIPNMVTLDMRARTDGSADAPKPSIILFDSLDGRYHDEEREIRDFLYYEYCELSFDGKAITEGARKIETKVFDTLNDVPRKEYCRVEAVRVEDHVLIRIIGYDKTSEYIIALPDSSRFSYIAFTGEHCIISDMSMKRSADAKDESYIPRIAEKISYIDVPEGDIPNVQADRYRSASSKGITLKDGMTISFRSMSLPTARLIWHCPFCVIYSSDDGMVTGNNYVEYALIRLDGETWDDTDAAGNELIVTRDGFEGWDYWKKRNKEGMDVSITFEKDGNKIITRTENQHIFIKNTTIIKNNASDIYVALTGDQCAITDIRIERSGA